MIRLHEVLQNEQFFYVVMDLCQRNLADLISQNGLAIPNGYGEHAKEEFEVSLETPHVSERRVLREEDSRKYFR